MAVSLIPLLFFAFTVTNSMTSTYVSIKKEELSRSAIYIAGTVEQSNYLTDESKRASVNLDFLLKSEERQHRILILDRYGKVLNDTNKTDVGVILMRPEVVAALAGKDEQNFDPEQRRIYAATPVLDENSEPRGAVLIVASLTSLFQPIDDIENRLIYYMAMTLIIVTSLVFFISQILIEPLKGITMSVQKMSDGNLNVRTEIDTKDEFAEMGRSFNIMAERLEAVEKTRGEFVSNVSHELKTPLSSIKVLTESILLQSNVPVEMYTEFLQDINSEIDRMNNIVNDLLHLVKLDRSEQALNIKPTDLNQLIMDILKRLLPLAKKKDIGLVYEDIKNITAEVDEMKLTLAISNLIENAIKYTPEGGKVQVVVDGDHQNAFITVSDTGIGISEEDQPKVFDRFYRVDKTRDRETGGTGLGLAISHSTVLMHNGSIRLSSKENEGSTFVVRLPLHK